MSNRKLVGLIVGLQMLVYVLPITVNASTCILHCTRGAGVAETTRAVVNERVTTSALCWAQCNTVPPRTAPTPCADINWPAGVVGTITCEADFRADSPAATGGTTPAPSAGAPAAPAAPRCTLTCRRGTGSTAQSRSIPIASATGPDLCSAQCAPVAGTTPPRPTGCPDTGWEASAGTGPITCTSDYPVVPGVTAPVSGGSAASAGPTPSDTHAVELRLSQPINGVRVVENLGQYIALIYRYAIGIATLAAVVMIVYGGFRYLLGSSFGDINTGKQVVHDALIGLLLVLGAYTILQTVNPNTLSLKMPEIKVLDPVALNFEAQRTAEPAQATNPLTQNTVVGTCQNPQDAGCRCQNNVCQDLHRSEGGVWICDPVSGARCDASNRCVINCRHPLTAAEQSAQQALSAQALTACALDADCSGGLQACLRTNYTRNTVGILLIGRDRVARQGQCTDGREGSRCRCTTQGCDLTNTPPNPPGLTGMLHRLFGRDTTLEAAKQAYATNHDWTGIYPCQSGLNCSLEGTNWYCRGSGGPPSTVSPPPTSPPSTPSTP